MGPQASEPTSLGASCRIRKFNSAGTLPAPQSPTTCWPRAKARRRRAMTPQERQSVDDLFDRLSQVENRPRHPDAAAAVEQSLRKAPHAIYALVQAVMLQQQHTN